MAKAGAENTPKPIEPAPATDTEVVEKKNLWKRIVNRDKSKKRKSKKSKDSSTEQTIELTTVPSVGTAVSSVETAVNPVDQSVVVCTPEFDIGTLPEEAIVGEILADASRQAATRQAALGFYNRLRWGDHDRKALLNAIDEIERANTQLDDLLKLRSPAKPDVLFGREGNSLKLRPAMERVEQVQQALKRLHDALARAVPSSLQDNEVYSRPPSFSIQISEQPEFLAADLAEQLSREDSGLLKTAAAGSHWVAWTVQAHGFKAIKDENTSVLFYALTGLQPHPVEPESSSEAAILDLCQESQRNLDPKSEDLYRICRTVGSSADAHHLVIHHSGLWRRTESLRNVLSTETVAREEGQQPNDVDNTEKVPATDSHPPPDSPPAESTSDQPTNPSSDTAPSPSTASSPKIMSTPTLDITLPERLQLARLIVVAFLHTALISRATERGPRPENIFFYRPLENNNDEDTPEVSPILSPYLTIDFGRTNKHTRGKAPLGTTSGLSKKVVNPVAELGLALFQIGAGMALEYCGGRGGDVRKAVKEARLRMREIGVRCGPDFAEAVALCLDKNGGLYEPVGQGDYEFMEKLRGSLWERDVAVVD